MQSQSSSESRLCSVMSISTEYLHKKEGTQVQGWIAFKLLQQTVEGNMRAQKQELQEALFYIK